MTEREQSPNPNDYLAAVRANNPELANYWLGAKPKQSIDPKPRPAPTRDVKQMSDIDLAFEYRECKESGECGARLTELERETTEREFSKGSPKKAEDTEKMAAVATSIKRGCLPCSTGHLSTCTGLLNEAMRFARTEGLGSDQVIEDTSACISELNAMERVDLRPEKVAALSPVDKELALEVLQLSKETRLALESMTTPDDLEKIAAQLQPRQVAIFKKWFRNKLSTMTSQEKR